MNNRQELAARRRINLLRWMDDRGMTRTDLAARLSVGRAYVSLLFKPERAFGEQAARSIEASLSMPAGYLDLDGLANEFTENWTSPGDLTQGMHGLVSRVELLVNPVTRELFRNVRRLPPLAFDQDWLLKSKVTDSQKLVFAVVAGDAMEPYLQPGDLYMLDHSQTTIEPSACYAIRYGDEIRVRRLSRRFDGGLVLSCDNPRYKEESLSEADAGQIKILGRILWRAG